MPKKRPYGFVFLWEPRGEQSLAKIIAHELGHGLFRLEHTFQTYPSLTKGSTDNLMDYGRGTRLHQYQWDYVHNPQAMLGWFQDEEENAFISTTDYVIADPKAYIRESKAPYNIKTPKETLDQGLKVDILEVLVTEKYVRVGTCGSMCPEDEIYVTHYSNLKPIIKLDEEQIYRVNTSSNSYVLPYSSIRTGFVTEVGSYLKADKICGNYVQIQRGTKDAEGQWVNKKYVERVDKDHSSNSNWMTDVEVTGDNIPKATFEKIIKNREGVNDRTNREIYKSNRLKSYGSGHFYTGNSGTNPCFTGTAFEQELKQEIYNEIGKEGGVGAINTYDSEIFTWGKGYAVRGLLMDVIEALISTSSKDYTQLFANIGIKVVDKNFWVLDNNGNWKKDNLLKKKYEASQYIASNSKLLSFFIELAEKSDYSEDVLNAQVDVFIEKGAGKYPSYILNSSKTGYADNWNHESVTVLCHLSHWCGYSWSRGNERYKSTKGDLDKIIYKYLYNTVKGFKSVRLGGSLATNIYRWNNRYEVMDRLRQFGNPESAGLDKLNDTWSNHEVKLEFVEDTNKTLRAKKNSEQKYVSNEASVIIQKGEKHIVVTKNASAVSYEKFKATEENDK